MGPGLGIPQPRLITVFSLSEIMPQNVQPVDNPSSPQRSVCLSSAGQPALLPLGRRWGHAAWPPLGSGTSEECTFHEDSRVTLLLGSPP